MAALAPGNGPGSRALAIVLLSALALLQWLAWPPLLAGLALYTQAGLLLGSLANAAIVLCRRGLRRSP